jgi:hypothetical protein
MAFRTTSPLVVNLSLPSKVLEYFAAARPILVHAPAASFIAHYAREKGFAAVVDTPDPKELSRAVRDLIVDTARSKALVERGLSTLKEHDAKTLSRRVQLDLELIHDESKKGAPDERSA